MASRSACTRASAWVSPGSPAPASRRWRWPSCASSNHRVASRPARCGWTGRISSPSPTRRCGGRASPRIALVPQGSMNSLNPVLRIRGPDRGRAPGPRRGGRRAAAPRPIAGAPAAGRPRPRGRRHVPAPAERRHEAAGLHRDRREPLPQGDRGRRAHERARRGRPAPGHGHAGPGPDGAGGRGHPGRPRHGADGPVRRPPRRHVRGPAGGDLAGSRGLHGAAAIRTRGC